MGDTHQRTFDWFAVVAVCYYSFFVLGALLIVTSV